MNDASNVYASKARAALEARGAIAVDLPALLPAHLVLELAGDDLRSRLFFTTGPDGAELCLRADLTVPAALHYCEVAQGDNQPAAWLCEGKVFRAPRAGESRAPEFTQIGLERFGDQDLLATDIEVYLSAFEACAALSAKDQGTNSLATRFCDGGLMPHILQQADIPAPWKQSLIERSHHAKALHRKLSQACGPNESRAIGALERTLANLERDQARQTVHEVLLIAGLSLPGARSLNDVADRMVARAKRAVATPLPASLARVLVGLLNVRSEIGQSQTSLDETVRLAAQIGVDLSDWRHSWQVRLDGISKSAPVALKRAHFESAGPEMFDYYDGFVFDLDQSPIFARPLASGGRYDRLVELMSDGHRRAQAVGFVIRLSRLDGQSA